MGHTPKGALQRQKAPQRVPTRLIAVATFALVGLGPSVLVAGGAGAVMTHTKSVLISAVKNKKLGTFLESGGRAVYTLQASSTACTAACLKVWPAVVLPTGTTKATAGNGVSSSKLGVMKTASGTLQVTYDGKALYTFVGDTSKGDVKGNKLTDTWGTWLDVVTVKGTASHSGGATTPKTSPSGGGTAF
jgi:predicted lipoprotein with Yx(FWY)xxD motif